MNVLEIKDAIYDWMAANFAGDIIFSHPNAERPSTQYAIINIMSGGDKGEPCYDLATNPDETLTQTVDKPKSIFVSINIYYDNATEKANILKDSLDEVQVYEDLYLSGLGVISISDIRRIPEEINKQWEERSQFDIEFLYKGSSENIIERIETIEVNGETYGAIEPVIPTVVIIYDDTIIAEDQILEDQYIMGG